MTNHIEPIADPIPTACVRIGISRSTAYLEIADGRLIAVKARGRTLIARAEQDRWLEALPKAGAAGMPR
jgi:excisionase family DNA binding protein